MPRIRIILVFFSAFHFAAATAWACPLCLGITRLEPTMVLAEKRPALWIAAGVVGFFAVFHGHAHGTELPAGQSGLLYSMGFVMATGCLHGVGIGIGLIHRWAAGRVILRVAGATVAVAGIVFLFSAFK